MRRVAAILLIGGCVRSGGGGGSVGSLPHGHTEWAVAVGALGVACIGLAIYANDADTDERLTLGGAGVAMLPFAYLIYGLGEAASQPSDPTPPPKPVVIGYQREPTVAPAWIAAQMQQAGPGVSACAKQHAGGPIRAEVSVATDGSFTMTSITAPDGTPIAPPYATCLDGALRVMRFPATINGATFVAPYGAQ